MLGEAQVNINSQESVLQKTPQVNLSSLVVKEISRREIIRIKLSRCWEQIKGLLIKYKNRLDSCKRINLRWLVKAMPKLELALIGTNSRTDQ